MKNTKRKLTNYNDLTEHKKDKILEYIRVKGVPISKAALDLGLATSTINRIFSERFGKRGKTELNTRKDYFQEYYKQNKFK